jgi:hypothetical protein
MERIVEGEDPSPSDTFLVRRVPVSDTHYCSTPIWLYGMSCNLDKCL